MAHLDRYGGVLVELDRATAALLEEVVTESYLLSVGSPDAGRECLPKARPPAALAARGASPSPRP
jgi:hypothetical protein